MPCSRHANKLGLSCDPCCAAQVKWLGGVLEGNAGRSKMSFTPESVAPDGFMVNVAAGTQLLQQRPEG